MLRVLFCILGILFMFVAFEKIQEYSKPYEVGVSGCVSESVSRGMMRASSQWRSRPAVHRLPTRAIPRRGLHKASQRLSSTTSNTYTMGLCGSTTSRFRSTKRIGQGAISGQFQSTEGIDQGAMGGEPKRQRYASFSCIVIRFELTWPMRNSPRTASIHILDDDSLLNVFYLYRPFLLGEDDPEVTRLFGGWGRWDRGQWWYKLAHVCQRWRNIVLGSAAYLDISLVCINDTPVADMLGHSPPLPLAIDYSFDDDNNVTTEDEEGAILALCQYNRVRRLRLNMPPTSLQKLITTMSDEYPLLEYLIISLPVDDKTTILTFPETLQAPHLRHLLLIGFALPIGSRLLTTAVGLVTLCLVMANPSTYFHPNTLLQWLSFMPHLETLLISFLFPDRSRHVGGQLTITTPVTLPNLRCFLFGGVTAYLEALLYRISAPRLEKLQIVVFNQLTFSVPHLLQYVDTSENLRFKSARFKFSDGNVDVEVYPHEAEIYALSFTVNCCHLDWQVSSAAQIFNALSPVFSAVEHLTFEYREHSRSSEEHNEIDPTEWHKLLSSFRNVKTLRIATGLVEELTHCLKLSEGELPLELLPELQELTYSGSGNTSDSLTPFIDARQNAGRPINLVRL